MRNEDRQLPLLPAQEGVLFVERMHGGPGTHNLALALGLDGPLDRAALDATLRALTDRHPALRTAFVEQDGALRQQIADQVELTLRTADFSQESETDQLLAEHFTAAQQEPFPLDQAPLLRPTLLRLAEQRHVLLLVMHHSVSDGVSADVLAGEFELLYAACATGQPDPLPQLSLAYPDFVRGHAGSPNRLARSLDYWRSELAGAPATLDLPRARTAGPTERRAATLRQDIPRPVAARLRELARQNRCSLFSVLATGAFAVLMRHTGERDLVLGVPMSSRLQPGSEGLVGLTVNTMPLRVRADADQEPTFTQLLHQVQAKTLQGLRHQHLSFSQLVHAVNPPRSSGRQPVFQLGLNHAVGPAAPVRRAGLLVERLPIPNATAAFELMLTFMEDDQDAWVYCEYDVDRLDQDTVTELARHLVRLLEGAAADPESPLSALELMGETERERVLRSWNDTAAPRITAAVSELFAEQVRRHPDRIATVWREEELSYRELDERASRLARVLRQHGVGDGDFVGIALPRSNAIPVALLAVHKAGAAYVSLDPSYPRDRLAYMMADAEPTLVITDSATDFEVPAELDLPLLRLDDPAVIAESAELPAASYAVPVDAEQLAYIIYTSGSTGRPKGVMVSHANLANLAAWAAETFGDGLRRVLAATSINFDVSVFEIFGPLLSGGSIEIVRDLLELGERGSWDGTLVSGVPSVLARLIEDGGLRVRADYLVLAGEALSPHVARRLRAALPGIRLVNAYGPTETTVYASASATADPDEGAPPIGRPLRNTQLYVLDERKRPVPAGVAGELFIAGDGLARGYLNQPELTAARFVPNPFGPADALMYRTGDLVRWRPDGQLDFLGRSDDQVKLRGFRIELGEVESVLAGLPDVAQAAVLVHEDERGERRLVGYVTAAGGGEPDLARITTAASRLLPGYMMPTLVPLPELPLTPSGKLDRSRLPQPDFAATEGRAPQTPEEQALAELFGQALGLPQVAATDSFFDLGGHSLMAIRLVSRIREELGAALTVRDLFEAPTVEHLAGRLTKSAAGDDFSVLLSLRPGGDQAPLFCVHPGFGLSWAYAALLRRLGPDQPVYGLQARGVGGAEQLPASLDELVTDYLAQIRAVRPHGPYRLLGWSFGGVVAHALATRLQDAGEQVDLVALLDTVMVTAEDQDDDELVPEDDEQLQREIASVLAVVPDGDQLIAVVQNLIRLRYQFEPGHCRGDLVFFTAAEEPDRDSSVIADRWRPHVSGRLTEHIVSCAHLDMMSAPYADQIGDLLAKTLRENAQAR
ncbi:amino acid adenylation domain-containing protein [Kitasatospora acidiphila]|uniref:Amino acid adenylation domain-containing protein n=1 Tax=Kitasatospora acidiphila TaxID=2567942 RepID=A0A540W265_9ACTN|nr:non-ribosomal peptide synthetase [Kitasatospora acidiphila]TQF02414.1 amino acid adenylation domain-containing protein [Kitasatospora acidiphila]